MVSRKIFEETCAEPEFPLGGPSGAPETAAARVMAT